MFCRFVGKTIDKGEFSELVFLFYRRAVFFRYLRKEKKTLMLQQMHYVLYSAAWSRTLKHQNKTKQKELKLEQPFIEAIVFHFSTEMFADTKTTCNLQ